MSTLCNKCHIESIKILAEQTGRQVVIKPAKHSSDKEAAAATQGVGFVPDPLPRGWEVYLQYPDEVKRADCDRGWVMWIAAVPEHCVCGRHVAVPRKPMASVSKINIPSSGVVVPFGLKGKVK